MRATAGENKVLITLFPSLRMQPHLLYVSVVSPGRFTQGGNKGTKNVNAGTRDCTAFAVLDVPTLWAAVRSKTWLILTNSGGLWYTCVSETP
jgi:hypothetical protein